MTIKIKSKELWIGMVEVRPKQGCEVLEGAKGAFVTVVTWAASATQYKRKAALVLGELNLLVVGVENAEPVDVRRERQGGFDETIEDVISRAESNPNAIIYSTFHLFDKDDA
jgi:hypothetical protein